MKISDKKIDAILKQEWTAVFASLNVEDCHKLIGEMMDRPSLRLETQHRLLALGMFANSIRDSESVEIFKKAFYRLTVISSAWSHADKEKGKA